MSTGGSTDEDMGQGAEKRAKVSMYGLKFQSAGVLNSVSERAPPKAPPKTKLDQCIDMFAEPDRDHVTMTTEHVSAPLQEDRSISEDDEGGDGVQATDEWEEDDDPSAIRPSFSRHPHTNAFSQPQSAPHFLNTLSHSTSAPTKVQPPPLPTPSSAHQTAGPPPLLRKGHHVTQSFKTENSDDEEDEGLIRARLPVSKDHKIKFSIKK